jgi:tetratricopeptide (TPR) repeat protein
MARSRRHVETPEADGLLDADLAARLDDLDSAEHAYRLVLRNGAPTAYRQARARAGLGDIALRRGHHRGAIEHLEAALALDALAPDEGAAAADRLGRAYALIGEYDAAAGLYERQLRIAEDNEDALATLRFATLLANTLIDSGNLGRAEELLGRALSVVDQSRDPLDRARLWWSQSRLHASADRPELAVRYGRMALELLEDTDHLGFAALLYQLLAHVEIDRGEPDAALELLDASEDLVRASGNAFHWASFQLERARALAATGAHERAAELAMGLTPFFAEASPIDAGRAYALTADVFRQLGDTSRARELYELAAETLPVADRYLTGVYTALAELLENEGRHQEALEVLKKALQAQQRQAYGRP